MRNLNKLNLSALTLTVFFSPLAVSAMTPQAQKEVDHLISYVRSSGCDFNRNGTWYSPDKGASHLREKFDYAKKRGLNSAEQFVEKVASVSSTSGKPYKVRCSGKEITASTWLSEELQRYRTTADAAPASNSASAPSADRASQRQEAAVQRKDRK